MVGTTIKDYLGYPLSITKPTQDILLDVVSFAVFFRIASNEVLTLDQLLIHFMIPPPLISEFWMRVYSKSKLKSKLDTNWVFWTTLEFGEIKPDSSEIASLLCIKKNKEVCMIYKLNPVKKNDNTFLGIIRNMFDKGILPALIRINDEEIGSCLAIWNTDKFPPRTLS